VAMHIFQACPVWIYTQSNITQAYGGVVEKRRFKMRGRYARMKKCNRNDVPIARLQSTPSWLIFVAAKNLYSSFFVVLCDKS
jgi:hypothetical protein